MYLLATSSPEEENAGSLSSARRERLKWGSRRVSHQGQHGGVRMGEVGDNARF